MCTRAAAPTTWTGAFTRSQRANASKPRPSNSTKPTNPNMISQVLRRLASCCSYRFMRLLLERLLSFVPFVFYLRSESTMGTTRSVSLAIP